MNNTEIIKDVLNREISSGKKKFVILPYGKWGKIARKELWEQHHIREELCIDNAGMEGAVRMSDVRWEELGTDCCFILVSVRERAKKELTKELLTHVDKKQIIDVFDDDNRNIRFADVKLDFLCVGFHKCGTTSLDFALKENTRIYTPPEKETMYLKWYKKYSDSADMFAKSYPETMCLGRLVGGD